MKMLLHVHQLARRLDWDHRKVKARLVALRIVPEGTLTNGRLVYSADVCDQLEASEKKGERREKR